MRTSGFQDFTPPERYICDACGLEEYHKPTPNQMWHSCGGELKRVDPVTLPDE